MLRSNLAQRARLLARAFFEGHQLGFDRVGRAVVQVTETRNAGARRKFIQHFVGPGVERHRVASLNRRDLPAVGGFSAWTNLLAVDQRPGKPAFGLVAKGRAGCRVLGPGARAAP